MNGILSYDKLRHGLLQSVKKYLMTSPSGVGFTRGLNTQQLLQNTVNLCDEKCLLLLLALSQSSSKIFLTCIANELILGRYQFFPNTIRQNERANTLHSRVFELKHLIASINHRENFDIHFIDDDIPIATLDKMRALKFISKTIITQHLSVIQQQINKSLIEINRKIEQSNTAINNIIIKNISDHYVLDTETDDDSHIQLIPLSG